MDIDSKNIKMALENVYSIISVNLIL